MIFSISILYLCASRKQGADRLGNPKNRLVLVHYSDLQREAKLLSKGCDNPPCPERVSANRKEARVRLNLENGQGGLSILAPNISYASLRTQLPTTRGSIFFTA
jgi:hypothetical protein